MILQRVGELPTPAVAEIGVAVGRLSWALLAGHPGLRLTMVDNWLVGDKQPPAYRATRDRFARMTEIEAENFRGAALSVAAAANNRVRVIENPSWLAANLVDDQSLDLVFIDADHSTVAVARDIDAWLPKVKAGGWIGGHDYKNTDPRFAFGVEQAVDAAARRHGLTVETDQNFTWFAQLPA